MVLSSKRLALNPAPPVSCHELVSLFIEMSFVILTCSPLVSLLVLLQFLPMGASECE